MGTLFLLPRDYPEKLAAMGIKTKVFNPFVPILSTVQNNRDHRKILVIDGRVAFTAASTSPTSISTE
jgi:cardiolipin synthase